MDSTKKLRTKSVKVRPRLPKFQEQLASVGSTGLLVQKWISYFMAVAFFAAGVFLIFATIFWRECDFDCCNEPVTGIGLQKCTKDTDCPDDDVNELGQKCMFYGPFGNRCFQPPCFCSENNKTCCGCQKTRVIPLSFGLSVGAVLTLVAPPAIIYISFLIRKLFSSNETGKQLFGAFTLFEIAKEI